MREVHKFAEKTLAQPRLISTHTCKPHQKHGKIYVPFVYKDIYHDTCIVKI